MPCPPTALAPSGSPPPNNNPTNPFFLRLMQQGHPLDMDPPFTRTDGRCAVTIRVCCPRRWHHVDADLPNSLSLSPPICPLSLSLSPSLVPFLALPDSRQARCACSVPPIATASPTICLDTTPGPSARSGASQVPATAATAPSVPGSPVGDSAAAAAAAAAAGHAAADWAAQVCGAAEDSFSLTGSRIYATPTCRCDCADLSLPVCNTMIAACAD